MPLKHLTETVLLALLAVVTLLTGALVSTLPVLPGGFVPSVLLFLLTFVYAASLYPLLRKNRADYTFRLLHFLPALLSLLWVIVQFVALFVPSLLTVHRVLVWGGMLLPVGISFILFALFCLHVIRRRVPRLIVLTALFLPYAALALTSEVVRPAWHTELAASLWQAPLWQAIGVKVKPPEIASNQGTGQSSSLDRAAMAQMLKDDLAKRQAMAPRRKSVSSKPTHLPHAGPRLNFLILSLIGGYCATMHGRMKKRLFGTIA